MFFNLSYVKFFIHFQFHFSINKLFNLYFKNFNFFLNSSIFQHHNLFPNVSFFFLIKKKIIKTFQYRKFSSLFTPWKYNSFVKFIEFYSGSKVMVKMYFFLNFILNRYDYMMCFSWFQRLQFFQKFLGSGFFLLEALHVIYLSLKIKDPFFLINWITRILHKISFWKHRAFFHFLQYTFKYCFSSVFKELGIKGIKFQLKGKVGVSGNARTRRIISSYGVTGASSYNNKVLTALTLIRTFTGVMGLKIWLIF